jgi:hypothetical protein
MRPLRMEALENTIQEILPLIAPLRQTGTQERWVDTCERFSPSLTLILAARRIWNNEVSDLVE